MAHFPTTTISPSSPTRTRALSPAGPFTGSRGREGGPSTGTRSRRGAAPDSMAALPLRAVALPPDPDDPTGLQLLQYWPFSSSDLYNWKVNHPPFSENPAGLTSLIESLMFSNQPTWDDCQQLLQTLFTTEEKEFSLRLRRMSKSQLGVPSRPRLK